MINIEEDVTPAPLLQCGHEVQNSVAAASNVLIILFLGFENSVAAASDVLVVISLSGTGGRAHVDCHTECAAIRAAARAGGYSRIRSAH